MMAYEGKEIEAKLEKLANSHQFTTNTFPTFEDPKHVAWAWREYAKSARPGLELVDKMRALSRASAYTRVYKG